MENTDLGESSCRKKSNNDKMSEGERPLKKAKYPWQVKGKCQFKNQENAVENKLEDMEIIPDVAKDANISSMEAGGPSTTNNLEILGDYLLKKDFNIPSGDSSDSDGVSNKSDMEEDDVDMMNSYQNQIGACGKADNTSANKSVSTENNKNVNDDSPSLVEEKNATIDSYIARWQARQFAKGFVDNTINRVLDSWLVAPLPQTYDDTHNLALDVAEFFDNLPANNTVENEGILMAISAHGLQNNPNNSWNNTNDNRNQRRNYGTRMTIAISECVSRNDNPNLCNSNQESIGNNSTEIVNNECLSDVDNKNEDTENICQPIPTSSTSSSSSTNRLDHRKSHSENELSSTLIDSRSSNISSNILTDSSWRPLPQACSCSHAARRANIPNIPFHKRDSLNYINTSSTSYSSSESHTHLHNSDCKNDENEVTNDITDENILANVPPPEASRSRSNQEFGDHFDFMDAAVSFAIQNKGLTSTSSVDYG